MFHSACLRNGQDQHQYRVSIFRKTSSKHVSGRRLKGGLLILSPSQTSSWSGVLCVAGKNVDFYVKTSNQVAALGRFRHDHAGKNIPFVWD